MYDKRLGGYMVGLVYGGGNGGSKWGWGEDCRGFWEGVLSGYRICVYYMGIRWRGYMVDS